MLTFEILTLTRQQSRRCQYNKRDWERLMLPIFNKVQQEGGTVQQVNDSTQVRIYEITFPTAAHAYVARKMITEAHNLLHRNASYAWKPIKTT